MNLNSIKITNPWWEDREAIRQDPRLSQLLGKPYYIDSPTKKELHLKPGQRFILRGARQVGKTTLLKEKILEAIQSQQIAPENCLYLSCEAFESFKELQEFLTSWVAPKKNTPLLLCLDEVTFIPEWQRSLLWLINAGLLQNATTLITGSNSRDLKISGERFPGRNVKEIKIYPASWDQFSKIEFLKKYPPNDLLALYLKVGGFPHAIRDFYEYGKVRDDTYETYANWIFGDAHRFQLNRELLIHLLFRIFDTLSSQVTWQRLIEKSTIKSYETALDYVEHLEMAFLCHVSNCYDPDKEMGAPRKAKKIYFVDPLLYGVVGGFLRGIQNAFVWWSETLSNPEFRGKIFESLVVNHFARRQEPLYYWYSPNLKREIDILFIREGQLFLYDVKSQSLQLKPALGKEVAVITPHEFLRGLR
ncbi:MAG: ATP-binding protein [Deltaproteobacteria bacterium]|nr:ATP-binding protein [Deltaproteobacteria bacterium]